MKTATLTLIIASIAALVLALSLALWILPANAKSEAVVVLPDTMEKANKVPAKHVGMDENQPL
jgi:hypothetical protein